MSIPKNHLVALLRTLRASAPADVPRRSIVIEDVLADVDHADRVVVVGRFQRAGEHRSWELGLPRELLEAGHAAC